MKLHTQQVIRMFQGRYGILVPDQDAVALAKDVWLDWEQSGIAPPDINQIAADHIQHENGFFYDIVVIAEQMEGKPLDIHYCAFCLDLYNFYAFSADDGYVVLVDDNFFQLLFFLCNIFMFDAQGLVQEEEQEELRELSRNIIRNNYFYRRRYDFSRDQLIPRLLKRDYELAEFANYFFHALKAFIISHEIGHHILGHTRGKVRRIFAMNGRTESVEVDQRRMEDEYAADQYGYQLLREIYNTLDESISYAYCKYKFDFAPLFLFDLFEHLESLETPDDRPVAAYRTHPLPANRREKLWEQFRMDREDPLYLGLREVLGRGIG